MNLGTPPHQLREGRLSIAVRHNIRTLVMMKLSGVIRGVVDASAEGIGSGQVESARYAPASSEGRILERRVCLSSWDWSILMSFLMLSIERSGMAGNPESVGASARRIGAKMSVRSDRGPRGRSACCGPGRDAVREPGRTVAYTAGSSASRSLSACWCTSKP